MQGTNEVKVVIAGKDGQALMGKHFHVLEDQTSKTFSTTIIDTFLSYLANVVNPDEVYICYGPASIEALPKTPKMNSETIAKCSLGASPILKLLSSNINRKLTLAEIETFLFDMRQYWSGLSIKNLYDTVRNFSLKKISTFERIKDNAGNFAYTYSRKDEREDVLPPEPVEFTGIPVFDLHPELIGPMKFDVILDYKQSDETAEVFYTLRDPFFQSKITLEQKSLIDHYLSKIPIKSFWGNGEIVSNTDAWKYKENGI